MLRDTKKGSYELVPVSNRDAGGDDDDEYLDPLPETSLPFFSGAETTLARRDILMGVLLLFFLGFFLGKWSSPVPLTAAPEKSLNSSPKKSRRFEEMMKFASDYSSADDLHDVMSPQFRAVQWLALDLDTKEEIFLGHELLQQYIMRVLSLSFGLDWTFIYHRTVCQSLHPPERPQPQQATTRTYGTNQRPKKQWYEYINYGFGCSGQDHISKIELDAGFVSNHWLNGTIPTELVYLSHLTSLKLSNVKRIGAIPSELGLITSLTTLVLSANNFTASTIPKELGKLSSLKVLSLAGNHLTGSVPTELRRLTDLQELYLEVTDLTGEIPAAFCESPFDFARGRGYGRHGLEADCFSKVQCSCCTRCCDREGMCTYSGGSSPSKWEP